ncbi:pentatricopeptide repeat-containing protein, mitochondrial-like protein isoform X1 [Cinnamomum micranthum f. kanehirae]|uniref:Pentatricopeptide repeat-containing protein, mitochondrial-like protein isoform X1 n=1 Tax=Cinnamomum micranthum f. kanehirae TaxID=337451 RepID=A0A443P894_9MAGN|nr:pentatricopeptide repeat-containing protein, mitochondrial-like protein isoform X1 [Cinnamomum micranthum f. kanehirae]
MRASALSISSSRTATSAIQNGTNPSQSSLFSHPFAIIRISYSNIAANLNPDDEFSRTQFLDSLKYQCNNLEKMKLDDALNMFDQMLLMRPFPSIDPFNRLLGAVSRMRHYSTVVDLYRRMNLAGIKPHRVTLNTLINCYCHLKRVDLGFAVLGEFLKRGCKLDPVTMTALIKGLCFVGDISGAVVLLKKIVEKGYPADVITHSTVINGLCKAGKVQDALEMLRAMETGNCRPNTTIYITRSSMVFAEVAC